jgi:ATP-dependent DNA helicase RecG
MERFRQRLIDVLVATVVVEVGVDVSSATVMVIEHAERFGLAQLHQLRGRIGRGRADAVCILLGEPTTEAARQRLKILTETNDGFRIAEEDLRIRGPGEFFGTRQHGLPELRVADLVRDYELLLLARRDAIALIKDDPSLRKPEHLPLREELRRRYADSFTLIDGA